MIDESKFDWSVRCFYGDSAEPPKVSGELAIQTVHLGQTSKDTEIQAALSRSDIGRVEVRDIRADGPWVTVKNPLDA